MALIRVGLFLIQREKGRKIGVDSQYARGSRSIRTALKEIASSQSSERNSVGTHLSKHFRNKRILSKSVDTPRCKRALDRLESQLDNQQKTFEELEGESGALVVPSVDQEHQQGRRWRIKNEIWSISRKSIRGKKTPKKKTEKIR